MIAFIDENRHRRSADGLVWGVELICAVCQIAPQIYYAAKNREPSARRGLLQVWLTFYVWGCPTREDGCHAQEVSAGVQR